MCGYAISTWIVSRLPTARAIAALRASGFTEVELSGSDAPLLKAWEEDPAGLQQRLADAGLKACSVHTARDGWNLDAEDEGVRQAAIEKCIQYLRLAQAGGIEEFVAHVRGPRGEAAGPKRAGARRRCTESLATLAEHAAELGVKLAAENGMGAQSLGGDVAEIQTMISGLSPHVGICLDVGHAVFSGHDPGRQLELAGERLFSLHIHDVDVENVDHFVPGEGRIDWNAFVRALNAHGGDPLRVFEVKPPPGDPSERMAQTHAVAEQWLRAL